MQEQAGRTANLAIQQEAPSTASAVERDAPSACVSQPRSGGSQKGASRNEAKLVVLPAGEGSVVVNVVAHSSISDQRSADGSKSTGGPKTVRMET